MRGRKSNYSVTDTAVDGRFEVTLANGKQFKSTELTNVTLKQLAAQVEMPYAYMYSLKRILGFTTLADKRGWVKGRQRKPVNIVE